MAQVNARIADDDKEKADAVLKSHGLTISGYFSSIIEYIADSGAIPFEITQKPKLTNFDDVFAEAVAKFAEVYNSLVRLRESLQPNTNEQMARCQPIINDYSLTTQFLRNNDRYIYGAPCQTEKITIGAGQARDFSKSRDFFDSLQSWLSEAIRYFDFNNRPIETQDLRLIAEILKDAEKPLKALQSLVPEKRSAESQLAFFLIAATDAVHAARGLTEGPFDSWMFPEWYSRVDAGIRAVISCRKRMDNSPWEPQVEKITNQLVKTRGDIDYWNNERLIYASKNNLKWLSFEKDSIDVADELVRILRRDNGRDGPR